MENCQDCGTRLTPGARFCATCGAPADSEETRFAPGPAAADEATRVASPPVRPRPVQPLDMRTPPAPPALREPAPRTAEETEEKTIFVVGPTLLFVKIGYALAALGGVLLVALLAWQNFVIVPTYVSIPLALMLLLFPAYKHVKRNSVRYTLTDA